MKVMNPHHKLKANLLSGLKEGSICPSYTGVSLLTCLLT